MKNIQKTSTCGLCVLLISLSLGSCNKPPTQTDKHVTLTHTQQKHDVNEPTMTAYTQAFPMTVSDQDLYSLDEALLDDLKDSVSDSPTEGLHIRLPHHFQSNHSQRLPMLWLLNITDQRNWAVQWRENTTLLISDLNTGLCEAVALFPSDKKRDPRMIPTSRKGTPPSAEHANDTMADAMPFDVFQLSSISPGNGAFAFTVLNYDWRSNTEIVNFSHTTPDASATLNPTLRNPNAITLSKVENTYGAITHINAQSTAIAQASLTLATHTFTKTDKLEGTLSLPVATLKHFYVHQIEHLHSDELSAFSLIITPLDQLHPLIINTKIEITPELIKVNQSFDITFTVNINALLELESFNIEHPVLIYGLVGQELIGPVKVTVE